MNIEIMSFSVLLPAAITLCAALLYATSGSLVRAGIRDADATVGLSITLTINVLVLWTLSFFLYDVTFDIWQWRYFIIAGLFAPALGRFFNYRAIAKLGLNISAPIIYTYPVISVFLAMVFLGERLPFWGLIGGFLVIFGGIIVGSTKGNREIAFEKKYLVFPILAAFFYGSSFVFRKLGIDLVASPIIAAAVTATASWILLVFYLIITQRHRDIRVNRRGIIFFSLAGSASSVAIPLLYLAFRIGNVVIVAPLNNTIPFFILLISYIFFREEELFSSRVISGTVLIVVGVILLTASHKGIV
jgi:DME family drug/metabolite transporter